MNSEAIRLAAAKGVRKRYPMPDNLDFERTWAGVFRMTRNWVSFFGRLESGVFASLGYSGVGLPRGTISGSVRGWRGTAGAARPGGRARATGWRSLPEENHSIGGAISLASLRKRRLIEKFG